MFSTRPPFAPALLRTEITDPASIGVIWLTKGVGLLDAESHSLQDAASSVLKICMHGECILEELTQLKIQWTDKCGEDSLHELP